MIYPVQDSHGKRIGTIIMEKGNAPEARWVAYSQHDERKSFSSWEAARNWLENEARPNSSMRT